MNLTRLSDGVFASPQLLPRDLAELAGRGFKGVINNRPDGEAPEQPRSIEVEAEARRHGLAYWHIPIVPGQATERDVQAFARAVGEAGGPVVAFCRTGNRSASLWKSAQQGA